MTLSVVYQALSARAGECDPDTRRRAAQRYRLRLPAIPRSFATDPATADYYERRAGEYDDWYTGAGRFASRSRPGWDTKVEGLVASLSPARTLDVACGTGFLTRHLAGFTVGVDQSRSMVAIAQARLPEGLAIVGDAFDLIVADRSFDRLFTAHFYGHLPPDERQRFVTEAQRVAPEPIVIDSRPSARRRTRSEYSTTGPATPSTSGT